MQAGMSADPLSPGGAIPAFAGSRAAGARFLTHPVFRRPGFGRHHPLSGRRQAAVLELCEALGWLSAEQIEIAPLAGRQMLERLHAPHYLDALSAAAATMTATPEVRRRYNIGTMECPLFEGLMERAQASVGGAIRAAELALAGHLAFHPGGGTHHGRPDRASGFCFLNDPAFALLRLADAGLRRLLYVDLDAHHGDGVELMFEADPRVTLVSIHEEGRWPGSGALGVTQDGRVWNIPVPRGIVDAEYLAIVERIVLPLAARLRPEAVIVVLGADGLAGDPLSAMQLSNRLLWQVTEALVATAPAAVVVGGGGYNPWTTVRLWAGMWGRISGQPFPDRLSAEASAVLASLESDLVEADDRARHWTESIADPPAPPSPIRPVIEALVGDLAPRIGTWRATAPDRG
jgi:acetoin utilization protein AcuC